MADEATATATLEQIHTWLEAKDYTQVATALKANIAANQTTSAWQEAALGSSQYHLKEMGPAVVHLQNAVFLNRFDRGSRNNLLMAQDSVSGGLGQATNHPADLGFQLATWIRPKESASLAFLVLNIFLIVRFLKKPKLKRDLGLGFLVLAFLILAGISFYGSDVGVVLQETTLKRNPLTSSADIRQLPAGTRVRRLRESGDFVEVERSDAFRGWLSKDSVQTFF